jgi:hypothetical protein
VSNGWYLLILPGFTSTTYSITSRIVAGGVGQVKELFRPLGQDGWCEGAEGSRNLIFVFTMSFIAGFLGRRRSPVTARAGPIETALKPANHLASREVLDNAGQSLSSSSKRVYEMFEARRKVSTSAGLCSCPQCVPHHDSRGLPSTMW